MKLSVNVTNFSFAGGRHELARRLGDIARRADDAGVDTIWVPDHLLQMDPTATVDEAAMMGLPFHPTAERFDRLEEVLQLAHHMWSGDQAPFDGAFHRLERPICSPAPIRRPRILIGGTGERRTLPLVARFGDACNLFDIPDGGATVRRKLDVLAAACADAGRDRAEIETTISTRLAPDDDAAAPCGRLDGLAALGIDHAVLITPGPWTAKTLGVVGRAIAAMAAEG